MKMNHTPSFTDKMKKGLTDKGITARSLVAFLLFGMIVLVFVLSDLGGRQSGSSMNMGLAAEVNGQIISLKDFKDEEARLAQYYSQLFGGQFDMGAQQAMLRGEVMNTIVTKAVTAQVAEKEGIFATDAEIRHMITVELPYFKKDGHFDSEAYKAILASNRMTPGEFENKLRQDIKNQRSRQLFESSMIVSELQRNIEKELRSSKMNLQYIQLSQTEFAKLNSISSEQISKKFSDEEFMKKVENYFKSNESSYETKEQTKASHILIKADASNDAEAQKKAQTILKRLEKEDFGKVAAQVSDDPGTKTKNGDLGFFTRGRLGKEFEEVAFSLPVGKTSGLVKTNLGYHIIKVTDRKDFTKADFEKVKSDIAKKLLAEERYSDFIKTIESAMSAGQIDQAVSLLSQNKMSWKETGFFDIAAESVPAINSAQAIKVALELTKSQPFAKKLIREGEVQYLIKLKDTKIEASELKAQEKELIEREKSSEAFRAWVEDFKKTAKIETNSDLIQQKNQE